MAKFESDIQRLIKEIQKDERDIEIFGSINEEKVKRLEKAIARKLKLIELLQKGEA